MSASVSAPVAPGILWAVGTNSEGQLGDGTRIQRINPVIVASDVISIATGPHQAFFVTSDGTLWAMGRNDYGQLGDGSLDSRLSPVPIMGNVRAVTASALFTMVLRNDGTLWGMGLNSDGQIGGDVYVAASPQKIANGVVDMTTGGEHSHFLTADGIVWALGENILGQTGLMGQPYYTTPTQVMGGIRSVMDGAYHSEFLATDGTLWSVGANDFAQLGDRTRVAKATPIPTKTNVSALWARGVNTLFLRPDRTLWFMGYLSHVDISQGMPTPTLEQYWTDDAMQIGDEVITASCGYYHVLMIRTDGALWGRGRSDLGQLARVDTGYAFDPVKIAPAVDMADAGADFSLFIQRSGTGTPPVITRQPTPSMVLLAGRAEISVEASGGDPLDFRWYKDGVYLPAHRGSSLVITSYTDADAGSYMVVVRNSAGSATSRAVDLSTNPAPTIPRWTMRQMAFPGRSAQFAVEPTGAGVTYQWQVSADNGHGFADVTDLDGFLGSKTATLDIASATPKMDGLVFRCVVRNVHGQAISSPAPLQVLSPAASPGQAFAMGANFFGVLGDGTIERRTSPVPIAGNVTAVAAGESVTLFLKDDGVLTAAGRLGASTNDLQANGPLDIDTEVVRVSAAGYRGAYVKRDGSLWYFGLGPGYLPPTAAMRVAGHVVDVFCSYWNVYYLAENGEAFRMGQISRLPDDTLVVEPPTLLGRDVMRVYASGSTAVLLRPSGELVAVQSDGTSSILALGVVDASAGNDFFLYLKGDGTLWGRGLNSYLQLGGTDGNYVSEPRLVAERVVAASAGGGHVLYLDNAGDLWARGDNSQGQLGIGSTDIAATPKRVASRVTSVASGALHSAFIQKTADAEARGRPINMSVRSLAGTGDNTLILGFVIEGHATATKDVVIRAAGPALRPLGVTNVVADPALVVFNGKGEEIERNDDWDPALAVSFAKVSAFKWTTGSKDAAIKLSLHPGVYTVHAINPVADAEEPREILIEIYDESRDEATSLVNCSCRMLQDPKTTVIAGVVMDKEGQVLLRHAGPSLGVFGLTNAAADTNLAIYRGTDVIARNEDWPWSLRQASASVGAFKWHGGSRDAAFLLNAESGSYTIHCHVNGESGVGLIELYRGP